MEAQGRELSAPLDNVAVAGQRQALSERRVVAERLFDQGDALGTEVNERKAQLVVQDRTPDDWVGMSVAERMNDCHLRHDAELVSKQPQPDSQLVVHASRT